MHVNKPNTDLKFNVAQLLREEVGGRRKYDFDENVLPLDDDTELRQLTGTVRFTRTPSGVFADVRAHGTSEMECIRCLTKAAQPVEIQFKDEFHSKIEVNTGIALPKPDEEDPFFIDEAHMLDLGEAIREYALLALPMQPLCRDDCKGICPICGKDRNVEPCECAEGGGDDRFSILRSLLNE
ncbi:MAG: hypothetical protein RLZZ387_2333 [Chloroflexota bacterium]|jgi:uncharacterized protein